MALPPIFSQPNHLYYVITAQPPPKRIKYFLIYVKTRQQFKETIYIIHWMTNKEVCDPCSSASMTFDQALFPPGYDRGPLPSSSC